MAATSGAEGKGWGKLVRSRRPRTWVCATADECTYVQSLPRGVTQSIRLTGHQFLLVSVLQPDQPEVQMEAAASGSSPASNAKAFAVGQTGARMERHRLRFARWLACVHVELHSQSMGGH